MSTHVSVTCPCCRAALVIDVEAGVVVEHHARAEPGERTDFDQRLKQLREEQERAADRMAEAMRKEQSRERIMEDRFKKLMDEATKENDDDGGPPVRDIDLD